MTVALVAPMARPASALARPVSLPRVIYSEWVKLRTVRSMFVLLGVTALLLVAAWSLVALGFVLSPASEDATAAAIRLFINPYAVGLSVSIGVAQLATGIIGVIFVTNEYATGMVRATFAAVPTRTPVLLAKASVLVLVIVSVTLAALLVGFFASSAVLGTLNLDRTLWDPEFLRALVGGAFYLAGIAVLGASLGWLLRSAAGAIATLFAVLILLPTLAPLIPLDVVTTVRDYLPSAVGQQVFRLPGLFDELTRSDIPPFVGFAIFTGYVLAATLAAAIVLRRGDA